MEITELEEKLARSINILKDDLNGIQIGQVSEKMLKNITIHYEEGRKANIFEVATIRVHNQNSLIIKPFMHEDQNLIEKSIANAGLGINTSKQGHEILATFPPITTERREEIAKSIAEYGHNTKQTGRDIRHNYLKANPTSTKEEKLKQDKTISDIIDKFNKEVEIIVKQKQESIKKI